MSRSTSVGSLPRTGRIRPSALATTSAVLIGSSGDPRTVSGFRLRDGRASYGVGLESFILGFPIHFDYTWGTLFNKNWEDSLFALSGGSSAFRKGRFDVWIVYDF